MASLSEPSRLAVATLGLIKESFEHLISFIDGRHLKFGLHIVLLLEVSVKGFVFFLLENEKCFL